tara:strand:+ start:7664 stop:8068 length:405 start_codon:yes stop_codon:yes gene_type:complete
MKDHDKKPPSNKTFGLFFCFIFFVSSGFFFYSNEILIARNLLILSLIFLFISILFPNVFLTLNRAWMQLGNLLGLLFNPIILGILFFGLFTPIGFLTRLFGRDELNLNFKKQKTYWQSVRVNNGSSGKTFRNQF